MKFGNKTVVQCTDGLTIAGEAKGSAHPWHTVPCWKKRIHGWLCYQMQSWVALLWPVAADRIMYETLRDQFEEPQTRAANTDGQTRGGSRVV